MEISNHLSTKVWASDGYFASTLWSSSSSSSSVQVDLKISYLVEYQWINIAPSGVAYIVNKSVVENLDIQLLLLDYRLLMSITACHQRLYWVLLGMGIDPIFHLSIVRNIVKHAREKQNLISQMAAVGEIFPLRVGIRLLTTHVRNEQVLIDLATRESIMLQNQNDDGGAGNMIPATDISIKALKTKTVPAGSSESQSCMICLEELSGGSEATVMPCSHVFHGSCIIRWLKQSHVCPICRFQMPISN